MRDIDLQTGIIETFHKDSMTGKIHIKKEQDVNPFLEANKLERDNQSSGFKGAMHMRKTSVRSAPRSRWIATGYGCSKR